MSIATTIAWPVIHRRYTISRLILFSLTVGLGAKISAEEGAAANESFVSPAEIMASVYAGTNDTHAVYEWQRRSDEWESQNRALALHLISVFHDPKASNLDRCFAAYYLADLRSPDTVNVLASQITLRFDTNSPSTHRLPKIAPGDYVSVYALIQIGSPSIPAMLRHLSESDDLKARELFLSVIRGIDEDNDIARLRLQKALKVETDALKQARLKDALNSLSAIK